jgi:hypothetical protein
MRQAKYITASGLKKRGWTDAGIRQFLGAADKEQANPHHRTGPPMRLYAPERVWAIESTAAYLSFAAESAHRKVSAQIAVTTKLAANWNKVRVIEGEVREMAEQAKYITVTVRQVDEKELRSTSDRYQDQRDEYMERQGRTPMMPVWSDRLAVNTILHSFSTYDRTLERVLQVRYLKVRDLLAELQGKTGVVDCRAHVESTFAAAYRGIKVRVLDAIANVYPQYIQECNRQMALSVEAVQTQF